jgi:hypothetical protein
MRALLAVLGLLLLLIATHADEGAYYQRFGSRSVT